MTKQGPSTVRSMVGGMMLGVMALGCGVGKTGEVKPVVGWNVPTAPTPLRGQATVAGLVLDVAGNPVAGASVTVVETEAVVTTDATGTFQLTVPSDSTLTVVTTAAGFAPTTRESILVANGAAVTGFDMLMLATDKVASMNAGQPADAATRGLVALRLHSLTDGCTMPGAHISLWPPAMGTIVYSRPADSGGLDEPDTAMDAVQAGVRVDAWILGALPPGSMYQITVDQPGCQLLGGSPSMDGMMYPGARHVDAQALTMADLFLQ